MSVAIDPEKSMLAIVDSHQHCWKISRGDYNWLTPDLVTLYQDFLPENLAPLLASNHIVQTVLVQAADSEAETSYLLKLAQQHEFIAGVVGWVDMQSASVLNKLEALSANTYFKGIRPMLQDIENLDWVLQDKFSPVFQFLTDNQLTFDALIKEQHLANIHILANRYPRLKIVVDHCAKPDLSCSPSAIWKSGLSDLAGSANVFIKFSGLLTEAPQGKVRVENIRPFFEHIISVFGIDRVMWGSDWPVINLNGDYNTWLALSSTLLGRFSTADKMKVWSSNAQHFYSLPHL